MCLRVCVRGWAEVRMEGSWRGGPTTPSRAFLSQVSANFMPGGFYYPVRRPFQLT